MPALNTDSSCGTCACARRCARNSAYPGPPLNGPSVIESPNATTVPAYLSASTWMAARRGRPVTTENPAPPSAPATLPDARYEGSSPSVVGFAVDDCDTEALTATGRNRSRVNLSGSLVTSRPGWMVTEDRPEKVSRLFVPGTSDGPSR